jgi:hypothetical protein
MRRIAKSVIPAFLAMPVSRISRLNCEYQAWATGTYLGHLSPNPYGANLVSNPHGRYGIDRNRY